jgi:membrane associated rhomboid family serine protease
MFPLSDENPTVRTPVATYLLIALVVAAWVFVQGAGLNEETLAASICNLGMVPGEITRQAALGTSVPIAPGMACVVDNEAINVWTPLTSMFLHGGWGHIIGNLLFFWVFGNNIEDSMGRVRFVVFYLLCGLIAAGFAHRARARIARCRRWAPRAPSQECWARTWFCIREFTSGCSSGSCSSSR